MSAKGARRSQKRAPTLAAMGALSLWMTACEPAPTLSPPELCHPQDPACASLDYDQDGVLNGIDDFPLDPRCAVSSEQHCGACERACELGERCVEGICLTPPSERCDGLDDDLDGRADEGLTAPRASLWRGVCAGLTSRCAGAEGWREPEYQLVEGYEQVEQRCDGLDNDCDGLIDERLTPPLSPSQHGVCEGQRLRCGGERGWLPAQLTSLASYEVSESRCDGLDNDCDGEVDEGLGGVLCTSAERGRCALGFTACREGVVVCEPQHQPREERCDGVDDDCDGLTDEEVVAPPVEGARGVCEREAQRCEGAEGWRPLPLGALSGYEEVEQRCDGLDNDCDGLTDEQLGGVSCELEAQLGRCAAGVSRCEGGVLSCAPLLSAREERCDGEDDDCDGAVDEGLTAPLASVQAGVCEGLTRRCAGAEGWLAPERSRVASYEEVELSCDGLDNDCDGFTDEALGGEPCLSGGVGLCATGVRLCVEGVSRCHAPLAQEEGCDGLDNDCDGAVDEGLTAPSATPSAGVCAGRAQICRGAQGWQDPAPVVPGYEPIELSCDGLDNDCDGLTDEGLSGALASEQRGVCAGARLICLGAQGWGEPSEAALSLINSYEPIELSCDGLDNDCDGVIDEAGAGEREGVSCQTGRAGECAQGLWRCEAGEERCVPLSSASEERCDGLDNDCDALIDESVASEGAVSCVVGVGACARAGERRCVWDASAASASFECVGATGLPQAERCDGLDNDCDGRLDEEVPSVGLACAVGVGACERLGAWRCEPSGLSCDAVASAPTLERCDSVDNDCDGQTDEGFFQLGTPCVSGVGSCEVRGVWRCSLNGGLSCGEGARQPSAERCDGLDNDCDGLSDEHARAERCDGLDNDCDGAVDEALGPELCDLEDNDCDGEIDESPCAPCGADCPTLSWRTLPAGEFTMGEGASGDSAYAPAHLVRLESFQMSQEVSVAQYMSCIAAGGCSEPLTGGDCNLGQPARLNHPINCLTWSQAWEFARWVGARLPSEAQWEYAARGAGRLSLTPWLDGASVSCARAHLSDAAGFGCGQGASVPSCSEHLVLGNSPQGLCDLLGNVAEWVWDDYVEGYEGAPEDGRPRCGVFGCSAEGQKVTRGGGWRAPIEGVDALQRSATLPQLRAADLGFRVVRSGP